MEAPANTLIPRTLRFPIELHSEITARAQKEERSFNWLAIRMLQEKVQEDNEKSRGKQRNQW